MMVQLSQLNTDCMILCIPLAGRGTIMGALVVLM